MAKSRQRNSMTANKPRPMMQPRTGKQGHDHVAGDFGEDPWTTLVNGHDAAAGTRPSAEDISPTQASQASLKSQLVSHFGGAGQNPSKTQSTTSIPISTTETDKDDNIALPTPIHATLPCKLVAADGRVEYIYTPIGGFEHLFKRQEATEARPVDAISSDTSSSATRQIESQQSQKPGKASLSCTTSRSLSAAGTPQHCSAHESQQRHNNNSRGSGKVHVPSGKKNGSKSSTSKDLKRTRSVAQGLCQPRRARAASYHDDNEDDNDDEIAVAVETSKTFHVGDIEGLKNFFRHRIDELTMKPVRGMVTRWVKQLEPKRKGGYGPYHRLLPAEAPADATPPWWPQDVPYVEPAHLDKDGLLTLAVDLLLQHRDTAIDQVKRQVPWTAKLRQIAKYEIEITPPDQYSSSKSPVFSRLMQERAESSILPSLFDISQSYEDYVFQHNLWEHPEGVDFPKGKDITWKIVPRPPKQFLQRKRVRRARQAFTLPKEPVADANSDESGDTEIDEDMERLSNKLARRAQLAAERKEAKEVAVQTARDDQVADERTAKRPTPVPEGRAVKAAATVMAVQESTPAPPRNFTSEGSKPTPNSSFNTSMNSLHLYEDVKGGSLFTTDQHEQTQRDAKPPDQQLPYQNNGMNYANPAFQAMASIHSFHPGEPSYSHFTNQNFIDPGQLSMFNTAYPIQMGEPSFPSSMVANPMGYAYQDALYASTTLGMTPLPINAATSFNGLPYNYEVVSPGPQHQQGNRDSR